jgi:hypothetical protein
LARWASFVCLDIFYAGSAGPCTSVALPPLRD